jgi:hypothetical protein
MIDYKDKGLLFMLDTKQIQALLKEASNRCPVGSVWQHKKGGVYMVTGVGFDTEHARVNVHYYRIAGPNFNEKDEAGIIFDRPFFMWTADRFTKVNPFNG